MFDDQTAHLALPLPHPANTLEADVFRMRAALQQIDAHLASVDATLASGDVNLATIAEIVTAVKLAQADIAALDAVIDARISGAVGGIADELARIKPLVYAGL